MAYDIEAVPVTGTWWRHVPAGGDPLYRPERPGSFRWQRGAVVEGFYLAADEPTAWAEWYRWLAEAGLGPRFGLPRDLWRFAVELPRVADLYTRGALERVGLPAVAPDRGQWRAYQSVGERLYTDGWPGVLYRSAARPESLALCVFRGSPAIRGVTPIAPPLQLTDAPVVPRGLRT